jgi:hypothetical protein
VAQLNQITNIRASEIYDDTLDNTQAKDGSVVQDLQTDLNMLRTVARLLSGSANWYDTPVTNIDAINTALSSTGTDLSTHTADATIHFTEASISHLNIQDIGVNTHAQIDAHIADLSNPHGITPASIGAASAVHTHVAGEITDFAAAVDALIPLNATVAANAAHVADGSIHFTQTAIDHDVILNNGINTHVQIDAHIADTLNPHGLTPASIGAAPASHTHIAADITDFAAAVDALIPLNATVAAHSAHVADASIHFTQATIDHTVILNSGTNTHAQIDAHIADTSNPHAVTAAQVGAANAVHTHVATDITDFDAAVSASPAVVLNTAKVSADGTIDTHGDVSVSGLNAPAVDQVLTWNGTTWLPKDVEADPDVAAHLADASIHFTEASISHLNIQDTGTNTHAQIDAHIANLSNPHGVTAAQTGASPLGHTHTAAEITDFDAAVSVNPDVAANTLKVSADGSVTTHFDVDTIGPNAPDVGSVLTWSGACWVPSNGVSSPGPAGNVVGPGSSTDNALVRWDGTTGELIQDSDITLSDPSGGGVIFQSAPGLDIGLQAGAGGTTTLYHSDSNPALEITATLGGSIVVHDLVRSPVGQDLVFDPDGEMQILGPTFVDGVFSLNTGVSAGSVITDPTRNQVFLNTDTGELSVRKVTGALVSLEGGGGGGGSSLLEEGQPTPGTTPGFTQLFMSGTNEVSAIKSTGAIVNLESGTGGGLQLVTESATPAALQTVFNLAQPPAGETFMFVNGVEIPPGLGFTEASGVVTFVPAVMGYQLAATDQVDFYYEVGSVALVGEDAVTVLFDCSIAEQQYDLVYISASNTVAQADASSLATSGVVGWITSKPTPTTCLVSTGAGPVAASGLTAGARVFLSASTPGAVTNTEPALPNISVDVGFAKNATEFVFQSPETAG